METALEAQAKLTSLAAERIQLSRAIEYLQQQLDAKTQELATSEARFRDVIERNADAIIVVDAAGLVRFANIATTRLFGKRKEDLIGSTFGFPLVAGETTEVDLLSEGSQGVAEMRVVESEWEGRPASIASLRDVTERRQAELNARALIREQTARGAAEAAALRLRFLLESSTVLAASLDHATVLTELARLCVDKLADWALVYCVDDAGCLRRLEIAAREPSAAELVRELRETPFEPADTHPVITAIRTREPLLAVTVDEKLLESMGQDASHRALIRRLHVESLMIVPMVAHGRELGAIALASTRADRRFDEEDLALVEDIAVRGALAIDNARLYAEVKKANETKADFLAVVSHDLRTPLTAILGYSDLLDIGIPEALPSSALERVQRIRTSARHLLYLLNELLAFARLDAGHEELRLSDADVRDIARDVAAVIEPLAQARGLQFVLEPCDAPQIVRTDADKLRQILLNLLGNAVKYTERGEVRMRVGKTADGAAEIRVSDTGAGIAPEHLDKIFEPFWQVDQSRRMQNGGVGLGLSVVRRLANFLGGDLRLESALGRGSAFTLTLPPS
jgi:signal transduction histidine kinase